MKYLKIIHVVLDVVSLGLSLFTILQVLKEKTLRNAIKPEKCRLYENTGGVVLFMVHPMLYAYGAIEKMDLSA